MRKQTKSSTKLSGSDIQDQQMRMQAMKSTKAKSMKSAPKVEKMGGMKKGTGTAKMTPMSKMKKSKGKDESIKKMTPPKIKDCK